jgi:DNA-binding NarL/FixJ family response regulator
MNAPRRPGWKRAGDRARRPPRPSFAAPADLQAFSIEGDEEVALLAWQAGTPARAFGELTPAEAHVVELMCAGLSNGEIARRRGRSPRTIANQVARVFDKLGVRSRAELFATVWGRAGREGPP